MLGGGPPSPPVKILKVPSAKFLECFLGILAKISSFREVASVERNFCQNPSNSGGSVDRFQITGGPKRTRKKFREHVCL